jgi:hypothetical protein
MLAIRKEYIGKVVQFSKKSGIVTMNDQTSKDELELLFKLNHPAVYVVEKTIKEEKK